MAVIVSSPPEQSQVIRGLHGGGGDIRVTYLAIGGVLFSEMQLFEWGEVPPGAGAARHRHTRTEELFLILAGRALVGLGDEQREIGPGDAILTGRGGEHWITAVGDEPLRLLIFEAMLYVERGSGRATTADGEQIWLTQDMAITLLRGELLSIETLDGDGLALYLVEIAASPR